MPVRFNDGRKVPRKWHAEAAEEILDQFGAVTFDYHKAKGRWRNQGVEYRDELSRIIVDMPDTAENRAWMKQFKARWKTRLQQVELWMVSYGIEIE